MKIKDYKLFIESKTDIDSICKKYGIKNYTINDDVTIDVDSYVNLTEKGLTKLPLKFGKVTGYFNCDNNLLTSLEGSPNWVGGCFSCGDNKLKTLNGCPSYVGGYFDCYNNQLTTLKGGPETVIGDYIFYSNNLVNFKGFPEYHYEYTYCNANPVYKLIENIPEDKHNKFIYWCNEFEAIDDNGTVIPERMEEVYNKLGLEYNEEN